MSPKRLSKEIAGQEPAFAAHPHSGEMLGQPAGTGHDGIAVSLLERNALLITTLGQIADSRMLAMTAQTGRHNLTGRYGSGTDAVRENAGAKAAQKMNEAKESFARATGHYALQDGGVNREEAKRQTRGLFSYFLKRYYRDPQARNSYIKTLDTQINNVQASRSVANRAENKRPHAPETATADTEKLDTRARMRAILEDPRAGYFPASNREKTTVMAYLDYLDNPDYPLGITNQLLEVVVRQQKLPNGRAADGIRAMESIVWELGDYLADATATYRGLERIKAQLAGVSPKVIVSEEIDVNDNALAQLIRFRTIRGYVQTGRTDGLADPLQTREERWIGAGNGAEPGKHKTVHNQYAAPNRTKNLDAFVYRQAGSLTVSAAHKSIGPALTNEIMRARLMLHCLESVYPHLTYRAQEPVRNAIADSLQSVKHEPLIALLRPGKVDRAA